MTTPQDNIIVDSCQFTPVYLIQTPGAIQGRSYVVTQTSAEEPKPVSDNLKRFYESSGFLENNLVNNVTNVSKPRILKKQDGKSVGNNLKLASFLLPKSENTNRQYVAINNVVLKPAAAAAPAAPTPTSTVVNTVPRVEVDRKIVKMTNIPTMMKTPERTIPKIRPKEKIVQSIPIAAQKHISVQLLKLGETYHSLNQLNDDQMKMVNQALKIFSDPEKVPMEPTYDPVTNTKFIYKVVSPRDLTVVGKNKIVFKNKKDIKKEPGELEPESPPEVKVTRSGRKVKFPKQIVPEDTPQKPRKKSGTVVSCFQCSTEFCSLYRLQKHYENHPTHIPARIHSNLFHCLLAIIKSGSDEDQANIFIQQLEQLIEKIKSLLPCLLKKIDGSEETGCNINDDIGKLFGMNPGKYNLNMDALTCVKDKDGFCRHSPPKNNQFSSDLRSKPSQLWLTKHNEEIANNENETEDCARINAVDKWPTANKRIWKIKKQKCNELKAKRMRLNSESGETLIELGVEDLITFASESDCIPNEQSAINIPPNNVVSPKNVKQENKVINDEIVHVDEVVVNDNLSKTPKIAMETKKPKPPHVQFHSTHFDIRSSPIKPSAAVFCKFQIDSEKIAKYDVQVIRPLDLDKNQSEVSEEIPTIETSTDNCDLQSMLNEVDLSCKDSNVAHDLNFDTSQDWITNSSSQKSEDNFMKSDSLIVPPSLIHIKDHDTLHHTCELPLSSINHSDHTLHSGINHTDHALTNNINHTDHTLSNSINHTEHTLSNGLTHTDHTLSTGISHNIGNGLTHVDHTLSNGITHNISNGLTHTDHTLSNGINHGLNHSNHTLSNGINHTNLVESDHLSDSDHRLQGQSVLNFLDSLGSDCLAYPETDIRNTTVDFQLDLFSFHNS